MLSYWNGAEKSLGRSNQARIPRRADEEQNFECETVQVNGKDDTKVSEITTEISEGRSSNDDSQRRTVFPVFGSIRESLKKKNLLQATVRALKIKLGFRKREKSGEQNTNFHDICFSLGHIDLKAIEDGHEDFKTWKLELKISLLGDATITLVLPSKSGFLSNDNSQDSEAVLVGDAEELGTGGTCDTFIGMLPADCRDISQKASPFGLVPKLLPHGVISKEARYVGSCFWIWLCIVDDLTENLTEEEWEITEKDLFTAFSEDTARNYNDPEAGPLKVSMAMREVIEKTIICGEQEMDTKWRQSFLQTLREILVGFRMERPLLKNDNIAMSEWMDLRVITISARPFFILARADIGLIPTVSRFGNPLDDGYGALNDKFPASEIGTLRKIECILQTILGLQNDILGWEKDYKTDNQLSAIQVLIQQGIAPEAAMTEVVEVHNLLVQECLAESYTVWENQMDNVQLYGVGSSTVEPELYASNNKDTLTEGNDLEKQHADVRKYVGVITAFTNGMATWMATSKRYMV